ncbi:cysteine-rich venom protein-like isoform X2 [Leptidea sinapis]|uniref:cysteine-rich venom protein-like isoform X2 n=1 Tax=Leptidea sinapis TaxID=189913 RepID=UPI0021C48C13|nr:cysteine-rich venom protein-like isoform X2 [Leptidea sinapis]
MMYFVQILEIVLVMFTAILVSALVDEPYCSARYRRLCQGKGRHVACQFVSPGPGEYCQNYSRINLTRELRVYITNYINRRRQRVAAGAERVRGGARLPRPSLMMRVIWDPELAHLAQRLANQCQFVHDDCRATIRYPYAGQSVGEVRWRRSGDSEEVSVLRAVRRVLDAWWGERRRAEPGHLTQPFRLANKGNVWGHFSQLAVWPLEAVGCGAVRHGRPHPRLLLVCDFSHTNMLGQRTIEPGPLAPCPVFTARKTGSPYPLLCSPIKRRTQPSDRNKEEDDYEENETRYEYDEAEMTDPADDVKETIRKYNKNRISNSKSSMKTESFPRRRPANAVDRLENELSVNKRVEVETLRSDREPKRPLFAHPGEDLEKKQDVAEIKEDVYSPKARRPPDSEDIPYRDVTQDRDGNRHKDDHRGLAFMHFSINKLANGPRRKHLRHR